MREIWRRILQTGGAKIYGLIISMFSISITARVLGAEGRGELVAISTWVTAFATFSYLSLGQVAIHDAAKAKGESWLSSAYNTLITYAFIMTFISWCVALIIYNSPLRDIFDNITPAWLILGFLLIPFRIWEQYSTSLLQAIERLDILNRYQMVGSSVGFIVMITLLLFFGLGLEGVLISYLSSQFIIASGGMMLLYRKAGGWSFPEMKIMRYFLVNGLKLHMNAICAFFITGTDIIMLNYYRGSEETAYYQIGVQLMLIVTLIPQSATMVLYGKVSSLGSDGAWIYHRKVLVQITTIVAVVGLIAGITAPWWVILLVGESFSSSVDVFQWLLLAAVGMTFSMVMAPQWIGRGYFGAISLISLIFSILNLSLNFILIPQKGMHGAIIATLITYTLSVFVNGIMVGYCEYKHKKTENEQ